MGVKIIKREYKNQFHSPTEKIDWLLGNVGDWCRLELTFEVSVMFKGTTQDSLNISVEEKTFQLNNGKSWFDYGFDIGDDIVLVYKRDYLDANGDSQTSSYNSNLTIINIYDDVLEHNTVFTADHIQSIGVIPTDRGSEKIYDVKITASKECEGLKFRYTHLSNDDFDASVLRSFIDGSVTEYSFAGINTLTGVKEMNPDGLQSGMSIKKSTIEKISYVDGVGTYKIVCDFMISSLFEDVSNFEEMIAPNILFNSGSLTDNFEVEVFPKWNNPNTSIKNNLDHTKRLGNTGWFNENLNGLDNNFKLESLVYTDENGFIVDQLDYSKKIDLELVISGVENLSLNSEFIIGFSWIPLDESDYKNKQTPFHKNLFINTGRSYTDGSNDSFNLSEQTNSNIFEGFGVGEAKMNIQSKGEILFNAAGTEEVLVKASFVPTVEFLNLFESKDENDRKYIVWVSLANHNTEMNFSDRVSLLVDFNDMVKTIPLAGEYDGMTNRFLGHSENENDLGKQKYFGFIEDDILNKVEFKVNKERDLFINSFTLGFEVENKDTGETFILESISENTFQFPKDNDSIQQISIEKERGFKYPSGNNKNFLKIKRNENLDDGNEIGYQILFGSKIRWEYWIQKQNVPDEFFNLNLPLNGGHNNWLDYLRNNPNGTYLINFFVFTDIEEAGELKRYKNAYNLDFKGYDENLNIESVHQYFDNETDQLLNIGSDPETGKDLGVILSDKKTRLEITMTKIDGELDVLNLYATIGLEMYEFGNQYEFRQISTLFDVEEDNPLESVGGNKILSLEQLSSNSVKLKCLINPEKLNEFYKYKLTGRIGCLDQKNDNSENAGKYEDKYQNKYE